jgi:excisionase family DNA binding protein
MKPNIPEITKRLYTAEEAAVYLARSPWTIRDMLRTGKIRFIRDGRRRLLDILDMNEWIENNKELADY